MADGPYQDGRWAGVTARITGRNPVDIDEIVGPFDPRRQPTGRDIYPAIEELARPEVRLKAADAVAIGVRVAEPPSRPADFAMRLASLAQEKGVDVIILNHVDYSGLERFGFRTERIAGDTAEARDRCEAEICRFWNIEVII